MCRSAWRASIKTVELAALVKQHGLRGIQVFRFVVAHDTSAKADRAAATVTNGKHDAVAKPVVVFAVVLADDQANGQQPLDGLADVPNLSST